MEEPLFRRVFARVKMLSSCASVFLMTTVVGSEPSAARFTEMVLLGVLSAAAAEGAGRRERLRALRREPVFVPVPARTSVDVESMSMELTASTRAVGS